MTLRVVELFAGIGSQRMALTLAGIPHEVVGISEIDRHALASYEAIWGDCPNLGDIRAIGSLPPCDLVTYSFPCQDLSLAGRRQGMAKGAGTRSGLVWEVVKLLEGGPERPEWLLMENVPQVITAPEWPTLVGRLEAMGYRNEWAKLDSSDFGSAQKRIRAFMVSRLGKEPPALPKCDPCAPRLCLWDVMEPSRGERYARRIPFDRIRWREASKGCAHIKVIADLDGQGLDIQKRLYSPSHPSPTIVCHGGGGRDVKVVDGIEVFGVMTKEGDLDQNVNQRTVSIKRRVFKDGGQSPTVLRGDMVRKVTDGSEDRGNLVVSILTPLECWRLMGQPYWAYKRASRVCSETQLYNQAGNSIVVEVLMAIFRAMFPGSCRVQLRMESFTEATA